jgi:hypothetical protein
MSRSTSLAVIAALSLLCGFLCYGVAGQLLGIGLKVGDAVIVAPEPGVKIPATVIGFSERGVKVRSEEPGACHGQLLNYAYDQCHIVERDSAIWHELTSQ